MPSLQPSNCASFMNYSGQGLCEIAQIIDASCGQNHAVSTAMFQEALYIPNETTANHCTCSWASYNILSACAICLEQQDSLVSWEKWTASCGGYISATGYYPWEEGYILPMAESIPYFSRVNPASWTGGVFNATEAAMVGSGDLARESIYITIAARTTADPSSSDSVPSSVIIGGFVGIVILIFLVGFAIYLLIRSKIRQIRAENDFLVHQPLPTSPVLWSHPIEASLCTMPQPQNSARRHSTGRSSNRISTTSIYPASRASTAYTSLLSSPITDAADIISPYLVSPISSVPKPSKAADRNKQDFSQESYASTPQRARMNPPPYSPSAIAGPSSHQLESAETLTCSASSNPQPQSPPGLQESLTIKTKPTKHCVKFTASGKVSQCGRTNVAMGQRTYLPSTNRNHRGPVQRTSGIAAASSQMQGCRTGSSDVGKKIGFP